jgi:hypothetical protein
MELQQNRSNLPVSIVVVRPPPLRPAQRTSVAHGSILRLAGQLVRLRGRHGLNIVRNEMQEESMSDLSVKEKRKLEELFLMKSGYVLDFSNRTLAGFVAESTGRNIYDGKYNRVTGSKAHRMRAFWEREPNHVVGKLVQDLLEHCRQTSGDRGREQLLEDCQRICERLLRTAPVDALDAIAQEGSEAEFKKIASAVREAIERNEPDAGLDRLHTYVTKLIRMLSEKRGITSGRDKPLHSLFGEYVKALRAAGLIESEMTERILKSSISTLDAFNKVRNEGSLAHDNQLLGHDESLLISSYVCSLVRFVRALEARGERCRGDAPAEEAVDDAIDSASGRSNDMQRTAPRANADDASV